VPPQLVSRLAKWDMRTMWPPPAIQTGSLPQKIILLFAVRAPQYAAYVLQFLEMSSSLATRWHTLREWYSTTILLATLAADEIGNRLHKFARLGRFRYV